jgi:hypothetical protein
MTTTSSDSVALSQVSDPEFAGSYVSLVGEELAMRDWATELVERARCESGQIHS